MVKGVPSALRPIFSLNRAKSGIPGSDIAGTVEAVGEDVTRFRLGDEVFGWCKGAFAEYAATSEGSLALKPVGSSFGEAAAIGTSAFTALQALRDEGNLQSGQTVLITGASGGVGTSAVQIAKSLGAEVTGVCGSSNTELVKSLGAEKVIDYTQEDATNKLEVYDYILDAAGKNKTSKLKIEAKKALGQNGKYVSVDDGLLELRSEYFIQLKELVESGHIRAVIDKTFPLEQIVEAHRYVDKGHKKGNVVITI